MARDWYTPDEMAELNKLSPCPHWERMNPLGWCVPKWWAGGAVASVVNALALAAGMAAMGTLLIYGAKFKLLKPAIDFFQKTRSEKQPIANRRRTRRRSRRRR